MTPQREADLRKQLETLHALALSQREQFERQLMDMQERLDKKNGRVGALKTRELANMSNTSPAGAERLLGTEVVNAAMNGMQDFMVFNEKK